MPDYTKPPVHMPKEYEHILDECVPFSQDDWDKFITPFVQRRRLLHGEWLGPTSEQEREAEIARQYHESCDVYDKRMCSGISPRSGERIPMTPKECNLVESHRWQTRRDLMAEYELTDAEFHRIITTYK
jgi:hypothetical protein